MTETLMFFSYYRTYFLSFKFICFKTK